MSSFLDLLPANERRKLRERLRSPEEYERLRERVKGPEDLEREMEQNEALADLKFETELKRLSFEKLKASIAEGLREQGIDAVVEDAGMLSPDVRKALEEGNFTVAFESGSDEDRDRILLHPEGIVAETIKLQKSVSDQFTSGLSA